MLCEQQRSPLVQQVRRSLNPCYSGICSVSQPIADKLNERGCLNPCYSGICSVSEEDIKKMNTSNPCLNPCYSGICSVSEELEGYPSLNELVLILVIVEYAL